ncbi:hypothetical protein [Chitinophaga sp.]
MQRAALAGIALLRLILKNKGRATGVLLPFFQAACSIELNYV